MGGWGVGSTDVVWRDGHGRKEVRHTKGNAKPNRASLGTRSDGFAPLTELRVVGCFLAVACCLWKGPKVSRLGSVLYGSHTEVLYEEW